MPPGFQDAGGFEVDPRHHDPAAVDGHHAQDHRAHRGDVAGISDGGQLDQLGFADLLELEGNPAHGHSAVSKGEVFGAGNDQDVSPVLFKLVGDVVGRGFHKLRIRPPSPTDHQSGQDEAALPLRHEVAYGYRLECHRISLSLKNRNSLTARMSLTWMATVPFHPTVERRRLQRP
jgi:hypothetical protein